jgi:hypothetical protein
MEEIDHLHVTIDEIQQKELQEKKFNMESHRVPF